MKKGYNIKILLFVFLLLYINGLSANDSLRLFNHLAYSAFEKSDFKKSEEYYEKALKYVHKDSVSRMVTQIFNLATVKLDLKKMEEGIDLLEQALVLSKGLDIDPMTLIKIYGSLGIYHQDRGEYQLAIELLESSNDVIEKMNKKQKEEFQGILVTKYYNIGVVYFKMNNFKKAIESFEKSLRYIVKENMTETIYPLSMLAKTSYLQNDIEKSKEYYEEIISLANKNNFQHPYFSEVFFDYAHFYLDLYNFNESLKNFRLSLEYANKYFENKGVKVAKVLNGFGELYIKKGEPEFALKYFQKALSALVEDFNDTLGLTNPKKADIYNKLLYIDILKNKAATLNKFGKQKKDKNIMMLGHETYELCLQVMDLLKVSYLTTDSKFYLSEKEKRTFTMAIEAAYDLYEMTGNEKYFECIFNYSERIKSSILISAIRENEALLVSGIPSDLLIYELQIKKQISELEEELFKENKLVEIDPIKAANLEKTILGLKNDHDILKRKFENEYPEYYQLKYKTQVINVNNIRHKLDSDEALLEYTIKDSLVYVCAITKDQITVQRLRVDDLFYTNLELLREGVSAIHLIDVWNGLSVEEYYNLSSYFYNILVQPFKRIIENKKLLIIPDEVLTGLPFEILTKKGHGKKIDSYKDLPYLLKEHSIYYAYSASLLFEEGKHLKNNNKLLSFAPEYGKVVTFKEPKITLRKQTDTLLLPLPGAFEESENILDYIQGKSFLRLKASEKNFKKYSENYKIIHLASHTIIENEKPLFSKIVFSGDTMGEDGYLNTFELYNMKLNAEMTVLSSCQTGTGKLIEGEGIMSLARGFTFAGCRSIAFTLWEIDDLSSSKIFVNFYKYIAKGYRKDDALRKAKLEFIEKTDMVHSHPYFWSAIVVNGIPDNLFIHIYYKIAFILILALILIVFTRRVIRYYKTS